MNINGFKLLMWIMSWAILLLIVAYSPIGSPDLYIKGDIVIQNQGINFSSGIENASHVRRIQQTEEPDLALPVYTPKPKIYEVNQGVKAFKTTSQTSYAVTTTAYNRTVTMRSGNEAGTGGGFTFLGSRNAAQAKITQQMNDITSISTDLAQASEPNSNRLFATMDVNGGVTDPGDDPVDPPIPVGDGQLFLLLLAVGYASLKVRNLKL